MAESLESASLYQLKNAEQKIIEIELAEQYIKDVLVAISGLAIDADKIDAVYAELDNIILVGDNIADIVIVADNMTELLVCANNIQAILDAPLEAWKAEASEMTSDSYATEPEDVLVKKYTSNGDGTFTTTNTTEYSSLHWAAKSAATGGTLDGLLDVAITTPIAGDALVYDDVLGEWVNGKVLGMPTETNHLGETVSNEGVEGDSSWRNIVSNPTNVKRDETMIANGMMVSPTIDDTMTVTVPDGQTLVIL